MQNLLDVRRNSALLVISFVILCACGATKAADGDASAAAQDANAADIAVLADVAVVDLPITPADVAQPPDVPQVAPDLPPAVDAGCTAAGCACTKNEQCDSAYCIETATGQQCAKNCADKCADGFKCAQVTGSGGDILQLCVPSYPRLCEPCLADSDCNNVLGGAESRCAPYKDETGSVVGNFCGSKCSANGDCAPGFSCKQITSVSGIKGDQCVKDDLVCGCDGRATKLALATACSNANAAGSCGGKRTCSASGLSACDAKTALPEQCNKKDDNCDGETDEPSKGMCDDSESCSYDNCIAGECQHPPKPGSCDDGSACTNGDECNNGKCVGKAVVCDDKNGCTSDSCDAKIGCKYTSDDGGKCSDENVCTTTDSCKEGVCLPGAATVCDDGNPCTTDSCDSKNGCIFSNNILPCTDGDVCTMGDTCKGGSCGNLGKMPCNDGNVCTDDSCDSFKGCVFSNNSASCSDNNVCTEGDSCKSGSCDPGSAKVCDDLNVCTSDSCDAKKGCQIIANSAPCSDNSLCTENDSCQNGSCLGGAAKNCDDGNPCTSDVCDAVKGCVGISNSEACSDNNQCTDNDSCSGGKCKGGKGKLCSDGNACTDDFCDPVIGCTAQSNNSTCNDGDACTTLDACKGGECTGAIAPNCDDGNSCTDDSCDKGKGCVHNPNSGVCSDGNVCTTNDLCKNAVCTPGMAKECDDSTVCTTDSCDAVNGCAYSNNAAPCNDGNICTEFDACAAGKCAGGKAKLCDDGNVCTDDVCDPSAGCTVKNNVAACDDNNGCTMADTCAAGKCKGLVGCDAKALCTPGAQSVSCVCNKGYAGTGFQCVDVDECKDGSFKCAANQGCSNTQGGYTCSCLPNYADCNNNLSDGCEANLQGDLNNCNACGGACGTTNAVPKCATGVCSLTCNAGYMDCDGKNANGCEVQTGGNDNNNCGGCGTVCAGTCNAGVCQAGTVCGPNLLLDPIQVKPGWTLCYVAQNSSALIKAMPCNQLFNSGGKTYGCWHGVSTWPHENGNGMVDNACKPNVQNTTHYTDWGGNAHILTVCIQN